MSGFNNRGIQRYLANTKPRLLVSEFGGVIVIGKASTISKQLAEIANHHSFGPQDIDPQADDYVPGVSALVMRGK